MVSPASIHVICMIILRLLSVTTISLLKYIKLMKRTVFVIPTVEVNADEFRMDGKESVFECQCGMQRKEIWLNFFHHSTDFSRVCVQFFCFDFFRNYRFQNDCQRFPRTFEINCALVAVNFNRLLSINWNCDAFCDAMHGINFDTDLTLMNRQLAAIVNCDAWRIKSYTLWATSTPNREQNTR